jgi:hypothetical protein
VRVIICLFLVAFRFGNALAQDAEADFKAIRLGAAFSPIEGFSLEREIAAAPGVRVPYYARTYDSDGGLTVNGFGVRSGKVVMKSQLTAMIDKTVCTEGIISMVEQLQKAGVLKWRNSWREDYQVPVYSTELGNSHARVTCRQKQGLWLLEYSQALKGLE